MTYDDVLYRFPSRNSLTAPIDAFATVTRVTCDRRVLILNSILKVYSIALRFRSHFTAKSNEKNSKCRIGRESPIGIRHKNFLNELSIDPLDSPVVRVV